MTHWIDGKLVGSAPLPARTGIAPFETMGSRKGVVALWEKHLARLAAAATRLQLPFAPDERLSAGASEVLRATGHDDGVLRLLLLPAADGVHTVMTARALLLDAARRAGTRVAERACTLDDVHRATALAHSNAVYGPRPSCLFGHEPAVAIVDKELGLLWKRTAAT